MRFAKHLRNIGDGFRRRFLDSEDVMDKTVLDEDWRKMEVSLFAFNKFLACLISYALYRMWQNKQSFMNCWDILQ